jgi:excinuclease UvrABC ATPase subunit
MRESRIVRKMKRQKFEETQIVAIKACYYNRNAEHGCLKCRGKGTMDVGQIAQVIVNCDECWS